MTDLRDFPWPMMPEASSAPLWNGANFVYDGREHRILAYGADQSGWSHDLTSLHEQEAGRDHPIDIASRQLAVESMGHVGVANAVLLDVGCSSGFVLEELQRALPSAALMGADFLLGPLEGLAARMPHIPILQFDLRACPLPDRCVDGVTCLNVLEHIDDHLTALREIFRVLKPGGVLHLEVPAGPKLFDIYDEHLQHHRRYTMAEVSALAAQAGFRVERTTHLGCFVFPAFWWVKTRNRRKLSLPKDEKEWLVAKQIRSTGSSRFLSTVMKLETELGNHVSYPWGIRCVARLRKPTAVG
jgi:ubiquinone/menaquinone biosynthesis C-methylase UbiE